MGYINYLCIGTSVNGDKRGFEIVSAGAALMSRLLGSRKLLTPL
jgi:hypothetical protein